MHLDSSNWHYFIYYGVILAALSTSLLARKDLPFRKIIKYASIWLAIAMAIITLYSFRYEFLGFKNRILGELIPSAAIINDKGQISINISENGHYYINSQINNTTIRFMIDTGASDISINPDDALRIGINLKELNFNKKYQTANGVVLGARTVLEEMTIGNILFSNIPVSVNSVNMGISLLGMSFLRQCKKYEFYQNKLILTF